MTRSQKLPESLYQTLFQRKGEDHLAEHPLSGDLLDVGAGDLFVKGVSHPQEHPRRQHADGAGFGDFESGEPELAAPVGGSGWGGSG